MRSLPTLVREKGAAREGFCERPHPGRAMPGVFDGIVAREGAREDLRLLAVRGRHCREAEPLRSSLGRRRVRRAAGGSGVCASGRSPLRWGRGGCMGVPVGSA